MATVNISPFHEWFKAQFGRVPDERKRERAWEKYENARHEVELLHDKAMEEQEISRQYDAALYAWQAAGKKS
jgi:hypothetical protein